MKKAILLLLLVLAAVSGYSSPLDFIVLLDISESMLPHFDDTVNFLIRDILKEHLGRGDGFHLLSFADNPEIELIIDIDNERNIQGALDRIFLLQPLGRYTDLVSALKYVYTYSSSIRQDSRKKILVLTDGVHDPPPESPYPVRGEKYQEAIAEVSEEIRREGWDIGLVQLPDGAERDSIDSIVEPDAESGENDGDISNDSNNSISVVSSNEEIVGDISNGDAENGGVDLYSDLSDNLGVDVIEITEPGGDTTHKVLGAPELFFPEDLGKVRHRFTLPLVVKNHGDETVLIELAEIIWGGVDILEEPSTIAVKGSDTKTLRARVALPAATKPGEIELELVAGFSDDLRIYPRTGTTRILLRGGEASRISPTILAYIGASIGALVLLALVVISARSLIQKTFTAAGNAPVVRGSISMPGDRAIEMYVEGQNSNIGLRNVHTMRDGGARSIGGGLSAFLIYLYPFPMKIAEIRKRDSRYLFYSLKSEYCGSTSTIEDCLDKDITLISAKGRVVRIRFRRYVSALEKVNRIMRLTEEPGPVRRSDTT